ncbi:MAG: c-type cytochrome [Nitrospirae bacterium]|nr:c-type cytochrome [Nitrospirota bacterium]
MMKILVVFLFSLFGLVFFVEYVLASEHTHQPHPHKHKQYAKVKNPVPVTEQSIKKGAEFYEKHCVGCHGEGGKGEGNLNLTDDIVIHGDTDGEIFHVITDGAKGTLMKGFGKELTSDIRWHLVNYVKSLKVTAGTGQLPARPGKHIRQADLKGYTLMYHLLDLSERNEMMRKMEGHSVMGMKKVPEQTNHLMVYIQKPDGKIVPGEVAFQLTGPDGKDFRTMTMGMYGGYGADISLKLKGTYMIRTNIIIESGNKVKLDDEFTFQAK